MTIDFQEITDQLTPTTQIETDWTGGLSALPSTQKSCLMIGHKTSAGSATANQIYRVYSELDAIAKFGAGSDLAVMVKIFFSIVQNSPLYCACFAEDGSAVAASGTVTLASNATSAGVLKVWIAGKLFQVGIANSDTPTTVGDLIEAKINAETNFPVTASNSTGTVTLTHSTKGEHGNGVCFHSEITCSGMTATDSGASLASGATPGDPTTVFTNALSARYHIIALNYNDATTAALLTAHCEAQSGVAPQKWCFGICGHTGTASAAQTLAAGAGFDSYRSQIFWNPSCDQPIYMLAAEFAAWRAKTVDKYSLNDIELKNITPQYARTDWPLESEIEACLEGGVTPVRVTESQVKIVRSVTTRQTVPISFRDHMVAGISDYADEYVIGQFRDKMQGKPLKSGSPPASARTVTPNRALALLNRCLLKLDREDWLQGVQASVDAGHNQCEINASNAYRIDCAYDYWPVAWAHMIAMKKTFITEAY